MNIETFQHVAESSGGIIYLMGLLLLVALTVAIERSWYLWKVITQGKQVMSQLQAASKVEHQTL